MAGERYSDMGPLAAFGLLANAMDTRKGADGDTGAAFPRSDAEDFSRGARFVPAEVTLARRAGKKVNFVTQCTLNCWYWELPDGTRIYHFDPLTYEQIGTASGLKKVDKGYGQWGFEDGPMPCPKCGNLHTNGGVVKPEPSEQL